MQRTFTCFETNFAVWFPNNSQSSTNGGTKFMNNAQLFVDGAPLTTKLVSNLMADDRKVNAKHPLFVADAGHY
ncbi:hypothetical protein [Chryseolinea soli]|uniref:Uncharacterized protein n=1 Tax=Chryseolinea soli TaxID=2321403 RepID=A0A385SEL1_9BACT|nr:hypothetical protein [Chryseolinea soli]AYB29332.1 hypothetical protein D4L85_01475 [Chryseolinea soli]